jgi:hypothetical protein
MTPDQQATYVDAAAAALALPIAQRDAVLRYFALAAQMAAIVEAVPLGPHDESGEVFRPVEPGVS